MSQATIEASVAIFNPERLPKNALHAVMRDMQEVDRTDSSWGLLLEHPSRFFDINDALTAVTDQLRPIAPFLGESRVVVRLAVYNPNFTYTATIKPSLEIAQLGIELEISVYPEGE